MKRCYYIEFLTISDNGRLSANIPDHTVESIIVLSNESLSELELRKHEEISEIYNEYKCDGLRITEIKSSDISEYDCKRISL